MRSLLSPGPHFYYREVGFAVNIIFILKACSGNFIGDFMVFYIPFAVLVDVSKVRMRYLVRFIIFIVPGVNHGARN